MVDIPLPNAKTTCPHYTIMPTTNTYEISLRLLKNTPFAVSVSADNCRQEKPPVLARGVPAILRIRLFEAGSSSASGLIPATDLKALYNSINLVVAQDFDEATTPLVVADPTAPYIDEDADCIVIPMSHMQTEELAAAIGTRPSIDCGAELQLYNTAAIDLPTKLIQFPCAIQNRLGFEGETEPSPVVSTLCREYAEAAAASATRAESAASTVDGVVSAAEAAQAAAEAAATDAQSSAGSAASAATDATDSATLAQSAQNAAETAQSAAAASATAAAASEAASQRAYQYISNNTQWFDLYINDDDQLVMYQIDGTFDLDVNADGELILTFETAA